MTAQTLLDLKNRGYSPRTMLDVGAHIGTFSQSFLDIFPNCLPTLIEPNPFCQDDLSKTGFEHYAIAAADKRGQAELFLTKEWLQSTGVSLYRENTAFFRDEVVVKHAVETHRIDDLFAGRKFDFVKIDTQGSELDVLRGGENVLRGADYILVEVSLVEYNAGGAKAEAVFAQLRAMGFGCADVTEFHRLASVRNGELLQMDFLFERRSASHARTGSPSIAAIRALGELLDTEGRSKEALSVLEFLAQADPGNAETLRPLAKLLGAQGRVLDALHRLCELKSVSLNMEELLSPVREQLAAALEKYNAHLAAGEISEAEKYAAAMVALVPRNEAFLAAAISCNVALGRSAIAKAHARALIAINPAHGLARETLGVTPAPTTPEQPAGKVTDPAVHPLVRLRDLHDEISAILCDPLTADGTNEITNLLAKSRNLKMALAPGSEWSAWEKHYRVMLDSIDTAAIQDATPHSADEPAIKLVAPSGMSIAWPELRATAKRLGTKAVFFAAADQAYVDLYARWYIKSILKNCDVPFIVLVHVIGGSNSLNEIAKSIGIKDKRVFFSGDNFDASGVTTHCYDAPPKGRIEKPVAHLQSVRFLRLGSLVRNLKLPVFVSDIDLLLQRGVEDLLERTAGADLVLNRNEASKQAGSRLTANLLLVNPTENALRFAGFLRSYLERQLGQAEVSRWIDQLALLLAKHHVALHGENARIDYFDTSLDINNVMYPSYQANPFRFLSLYHGFDMSSLEDSSTAAETASPKKSGVRRARRARS